MANIYTNTTPWRVSYKKQELRILREHLSSPMYLVGSVLFIVFVFCVSYFVSLRYDFTISTMFGSPLPPAVCIISVMCASLRIVVSNIYCVVFFPRLVYPILPVALDFPFLIAAVVFSNVYLLMEKTL